VYSVLGTHIKDDRNIHFVTLLFSTKNKKQNRMFVTIIGLYYVTIIARRGYTTKIGSSVYFNVSEQCRISIKISLFDVSNEC